MESTARGSRGVRSLWDRRLSPASADVVGRQLSFSLPRGQLVHDPGSLGTVGEASYRRSFPDAGGGGGQRLHRGVGRRRDVAVPFLVVGRVGAFRPGPDPKRDPLAFPRGAKIRNGGG